VKHTVWIVFISGGLNVLKLVILDSLKRIKRKYVVKEVITF